jgi:REP-associated tyrosine transposase
MARPWRVEFPDAVYHVMSRGNNGQDIFLTDYDRKDFLALLEEAASRFHLEIFCFCLMSNHYHLFHRTPEANLVQAMHWINATYTTRFHVRNKTGGHLFQGRYKSVLVADDSHWLNLSAYIHLNPARAGIVEDPASYMWSSYRDYVRKKPQYKWLKTGPVLFPHGGSGAARRKNYQKNIAALSGKPPTFWEETKDAIFFGTREQWEKLRQKHPPKGDVKTVSGYSSAKRTYDFDEEAARLAEAFGVPTEDVLGKKRIPARTALYYHLVIHCGMSVAHAAGLIGVLPTTISNGINRFKIKIEKEAWIAEIMDELKCNVRI